MNRRFASLPELERAFAQERAAAGQPKAPPNFVFILCDDLRKGALSSEDHPFVQTPHIDRIGRESMTFDKADLLSRGRWAATRAAKPSPRCPTCSPRRAAKPTVWRWRTRAS